MRRFERTLRRHAAPRAPTGGCAHPRDVQRFKPHDVERGGERLCGLADGVAIAGVHRCFLPAEHAELLAPPPGADDALVHCALGADGGVERRPVVGQREGVPVVHGEGIGAAHVGAGNKGDLTRAFGAQRRCRPGPTGEPRSVGARGFRASHTRAPSAAVTLRVARCWQSPGTRGARATRACLRSCARAASTRRRRTASSSFSAGTSHAASRLRCVRRARCSRISVGLCPPSPLCAWRRRRARPMRRGRSRGCSAIQRSHAFASPTSRAVRACVAASCRSIAVRACATAGRASATGMLASHGVCARHRVSWP